jgi:nitrate reductase NapAB chaperone NapD
MPISGLLVTAAPGRAEDAAAYIAGLSGVSVTDRPSPEQLVLVTETATREEDQALWEQLQAGPGVHSLELAYHNFEDIGGE